MGKMFCRLALVSKKKKSGAVPVYLNVYDLTPINGYAYWFGLGVYHSGVQVHGVEYAFGAHDHATSGIFEVEPRQCPGFTFRKSICIGRTNLGPKEVRSFMEKLAEEYSGNTYHLITKNCNHFCNDVCVRLAGKPIPSWVNRLARLGLFCNCVLPASLNEAKVRQVRPGGRISQGVKKQLRSNPHSEGVKKQLRSNPHSEGVKKQLRSNPASEGVKKQLRSNSSRHNNESPSNSSPPTLSSNPPSSSTIKVSRQKRCLPPSSSLIHSSSNAALTIKL
ncbi:deSI-like protein At4g17486 isoform X2 [Momordica charantia]|uniref:DeSI-like protein At4g17486 isoform X2 n=1 Tax=Momordica charantia TaxID=3673 RepID=A0A6J1CKH1_MOMCH|nr:deSI-like protein At4g17486 isoform X2 [Momordica charantia]